MPAELMEAPTPRNGADAEAGRGEGIPPLLRRGGPRRPPRRGSRGSPRGCRRRAGTSEEGVGGPRASPDVTLERG